ncbi:MAG: winged helix-turn-helix domain-containing protein, partial [Actinomycetota bacterium]
MRYRLDDFGIDLSTRTITGPGGPVHVEPQVYDVTVYLLEHRDRAVSKIELMEAIWGDQFISESALTSRIKSARAALDDNGRDQRMIRTVHGFGYQFVATAQPVGASDDTGIERRATRTSLPRFADPLRGRSAELAEITALIDRHPLVTLVGTGGTGKTRLAVEVVSAASAPGRPAVFVDLAASRDADALPLAVAAAVGIETGDRPDVLAAVGEYLAAVPHTLIVDNCEHVLEAAAAAISELLSASEHSRILATSREPLGVAGERLYRLGPLGTVDPSAAAADVHAVEQSPAAQLFVDRARLADDEWQLDAATAQRIAELCRALDGLPLAIELAAGRVSAFGLDDLIGVLDRRLDVLGDRSSVREHRHRTLRATVEWSYDLLDEPERRLF